MGKTKNMDSSGNSKTVALADQIIKDKSVKQLAREKKRRRKDEDDEFVGTKESRKILKQVRDQLNEIENEDHKNKDDSEINVLPHKKLILQKTSKLTNQSSDEEDGDEIESDDDNDFQFDELNANKDEDIEFQKEFEKFIPDSNKKQNDLADDILGAISNKRSEICSQMSDCASTKSVLSEELVKLFKGVGKILSCHRSGPIPKPLKIIPKYNNWEELLELTEPDRWTAAAVLAATRIFVSNLKDNQCAKFMNRVLLPRIRDDIREYKKLNDHLYEALIKCMFKSYGFMKGILLPLCKEGDCTAREATIIASVVIKSSIKMEHSAAAMLGICELPYSIASCILLTALIDKKYALPYVVVDELVLYFLKFQSNKTPLPVLWHQCLLTFVQRYKQDLASEQKEALLGLLKAHLHRDITPVVRYELLHAVTRDIEMVALELPGKALNDVEMVV